jgi:energy-coupling factor transporter transmembrane protein EcfT
METYPDYLPPIRKGFRLDPRTKILFMALVTTLLFFVHENVAFVSVLASIPFIFLLLNGQRKTALIYGGLFILGLFANYIKNTADLPQLLNAIIVLLIALVLRLFPTFMMGYYIIESTKASEFITAMERWHVSQNFIIPVAVVFRFVPTIGEESHAITDAMRMREIQFGTRKFIKNPGAFLEYRVIPLMISIVKIGDELSAAALTRGLGNSVKRASIAVIGFEIYDFIILATSVALLLWAFLL